MYLSDYFIYRDSIHNPVNRKQVKAKHCTYTVLYIYPYIRGRKPHAKLAF